MQPLNELDGKLYNPNDHDQQYYLRKAKCYIDRTTDPPVIRVIRDYKAIAYIDRSVYPPAIRITYIPINYEIVGWVWLTEWGELKVNNVDVMPGEGRYFIFHNKKFPPGVYYLIRENGREFLVSEKTLKHDFD